MDAKLQIVDRFGVLISIVDSSEAHKILISNIKVSCGRYKKMVVSFWLAPNASPSVICKVNNTVT